MTLPSVRFVTLLYSIAPVTVLQATKASAAQSRVKMIEKMAKKATPPPEGKKSFTAKIKLPTPPPCHTTQVTRLTDCCTRTIQHYTVVYSTATLCYLIGLIMGTDAL